MPKSSPDGPRSGPPGATPPLPKSSKAAGEPRAPAEKPIAARSHRVVQRRESPRPPPRRPTPNAAAPCAHTTLLAFWPAPRPTDRVEKRAPPPPTPSGFVVGAFAVAARRGAVGGRLPAARSLAGATREECTIVVRAATPRCSTPTPTLHPSNPLPYRTKGTTSLCKISNRLLPELADEEQTAESGGTR
jgi:hypothetical protein